MLRVQLPHPWATKASASAGVGLALSAPIPADARELRPAAGLHRALEKSSTRAATRSHSPRRAAPGRRAAQLVRDRVDVADPGPRERQPGHGTRPPACPRAPANRWRRRGCSGGQVPRTISVAAAQRARPSVSAVARVEQIGLDRVRQRVHAGGRRDRSAAGPVGQLQGPAPSCVRHQTSGRSSLRLDPGLAWSETTAAIVTSEPVPAVVGTA
jgi:hypothetical protein